MAGLSGFLILHAGCNKSGSWPGNTPQSFTIKFKGQSLTTIVPRHRGSNIYLVIVLNFF